MSLAKTATRQATFLVISRMLGIFIGIGSILCYTRLFDKLDLALLPIVMMFSGLIYGIFNFGTGLYVQRRMPEINKKLPDEAKQLGRIFAMSILLGIVISGITIWLLSEAIAKVLLKDQSRSHEIILLIPAILFACWNMVIVQIMRGRSLFVEISIYSFVFQVINLPIVIILFLLFGTKGMIIGLAVANSLCSIVASCLYHDYLFGKIRFNSLVKYFKNAFPFYGEGYVGYLVAFADRWLIALFLGPSAMALYYVPRAMYDKLTVLFDAIIDVVLANMSTIGDYGQEAARQVFKKIQRLCVFVFLPFSLCAITMSFYVIDLIAGAEYHGGVVPFAILCLALLTTGVYVPHIVGVMTLAPPRNRFYVVAIQSVVLFLPMIILIKLFELNGISCSRVLARLSVGILSAFFLRKRFPLSVDLQAFRLMLLPCTLLVLIVVGLQLLFYNVFIVPVYFIFGFGVFAFCFIKKMSNDDLKLLESVLPGRLVNIVNMVRKFKRSAL